MKKLILMMILCSIIATKAFCGPPWWRTAAADAKGALEGGAAGAALGGLAGGVGAGPGAAAGALIGGAASSLVRSGIFPEMPITTAITNTQNSFENVGINHNKLLVDFAKGKYADRSPEYLVTYLVNRAKIYKVDASFLNMSDMVSIANSAYNTDYTINDGIVKAANLSPEMAKLFKQSLDVLSSVPDIAAFNKIIVIEENRIILNSMLTAQQKNSLSCFYATLRYSGAFWAGIPCYPNCK
jgi:hypothetical protein